MRSRLSKALYVDYTTFSWRTGLGYGLVLCILSLLAWSAYRFRCQQTAKIRDYLRMLPAIEQRVTQEGDELYQEIKKKEDLSRAENSLHYGEALHYEEAHQIRNLQNKKIDFFESQLRAVYPIYEDDPLGPPKDYGPTNLSIDHEAVLQALISSADSLRFWAHGDSVILQEIDSFCKQSQLQNYRTLLSSGSTLEKIMAIKKIQINYRNICNTLLKRIHALLPKYDPWELYTFLPTMSATESSKCLRVGDMFEADFFAFSYPKRLGYWRFRANGKSIPIEAGIGRFSTVYHTPGMKKITFEALAINPMNEQVHSSRRNYSLEICQ